MTAAVRLMAMISGPRLLEQEKLRFVSTFKLKKSFDSTISQTVYITTVLISFLGIGSIYLV